MVTEPAKRVGKFTVVTTEAESTPSEILATEVAHKEGPTVGPQSPADSVDAFTLKTSQPRRKGRPPGSRTKAQAIVEQTAQVPADYRLWAQLVIGSSNTVVVTWLGAECAMERREAEMLEPPVARVLSRLPAGQAQKVSVFVDPMVILIALGTWANRIIRIQRAKKGNGITDAELARASGMASSQENSRVENPPEYQQSVEPDMPARTRVPVNPNGIPTAITNQMGEV